MHLLIPRPRSFGELLRRLRKWANLTQGEFGRLIGYSTSQVARLEKNERKPKLCEINVYACALGVHDQPDVCAILITLAIEQGAKNG
ncbi:MAG: helix-turn-helix domain-containing protein [Anaerolineae bacterium]|nr:helix-turn-helix domain-containing protein [Anaerolineae bacterium]